MEEEKHVSKLIEFFEEKILQGNIFDYKTMLRFMKDGYKEKSNRMLKFFVKNLAGAYNVKTGEMLIPDFNPFDLAPDLIPVKARTGGYKLEVDEKIPGNGLSRKDRIKASKIYARVKYLDYVHQEKSKYFLTFTLPQDYHFYGLKKGEKREYNPKFMERNYNIKMKSIHVPASFDDLIKMGIEKLVEVEREFYRYFTKEVAKYIKKEYKMTISEYEKSHGKVFAKLRMIEPHKSLTPHLHALYYVNKEFEPILRGTFDRVVKYFELNENFCKFEKLNKASGATYVSKYITKNLRSDKSAVPDLYRHYFSNFRFITMSGLNHVTLAEVEKLYSYFHRNFPEFLEVLKKLEYPIYWTLEQIILNNKFEAEYKEVESEQIDYEKFESEFVEPVKNYLDSIFDFEFREEGIEIIERSSRLTIPMIAHNYVISRTSKVLSKMTMPVDIEKRLQTAEDLESFAKDLIKGLNDLSDERIVIYETQLYEFGGADLTDVFRSYSAVFGGFANYFKELENKKAA